MSEEKKVVFKKKWKNKMSIQLGVAILVVNLLVLLFCFFFQYRLVNNLLLEKEREGIITRFNQSEYNIDKFVEQIDTVLGRLMINENLAKLSGNRNISDGEYIKYAKKLLSDMEEVQIDYPYMEFIGCYLKDGAGIKTVKKIMNANIVTAEKQKEDVFYESHIYGSDEEERRQVKWYVGHAEKDFGLLAGNSKEKNYICGVRKTWNADTLVIGVDMEYFVDIFHAEDHGRVEQIYILNDQNKVVAAENAEMIGTEKLFVGGETIYDGVIKYNMEDRQVITYYLKSMDWRLVSEVPIVEVVRDSRYLKWILLFSCLISVMVSFSLSMVWVNKVLRPLKRLKTKMEHLSEGHLGVTFDEISDNEIGILTEGFNEMSQKLKIMFLQIEKMENEKREQEMKLLRGQLNPHLIYNVLNSIKWRAIFLNERNIAESVSLLAKFLRPIFQNQDLMCSLKEEIQYLENYVEIMNLLRNSKFRLETALSEESKNYRMIRFILQPLVENAILHGYSEAIDGVIRLSVKIEENDMLLLIEDEGKGITEDRLAEVSEKLQRNEVLNGEGIGILNVNRRIRTQYGERYGVIIAPGEVKGVVVTLRLPKG